MCFHFEIVIFPLKQINFGRKCFFVVAVLMTFCLPLIKALVWEFCVYFLLRVYLNGCTLWGEITHPESIGHGKFEQMSA